MPTTPYESVTAKIIESLERGVAPWRRPWDAGVPKNLLSFREYRGINPLLLGLAGYASPYWLTYKQAQELGGHVRKGEHGTAITFWKLLENTADDDATDGEQTGGRRVPLLRTYTVFNIEQTDGIKLRRQLTHPPRTVKPIDACEAILSALPDGHAPIVQGGGVACYAPDRDEVHVPPQGAFHSDEHYYATLFHELTHSTGHDTRLAREGVVNRARFASHAYSREELVAEMGSAFLCGTTGISPGTLDNSASYIQSWIRVLKGDARLVVQAASAAQKAVDWLRGRSGREEATTKSQEGDCPQTP